MVNPSKSNPGFGQKNDFFQKSIWAMEVPANGNWCLELMTAEHQFYLPTLGKAVKAVGGATALAQKRACIRYQELYQAENRAFQAQYQKISGGFARTPNIF